MRGQKRQSGHQTVREEIHHEENGIDKKVLHTLLPHVHVVNLSVSILRLADAAIGKRVAGMIRIHAEVEVVTGVSHGKLREIIRELAKENNAEPFKVE